MSTSPHEGYIPEFTRGDRLRKARISAGLSVEDFAHRALISPKTVNNYEGERVSPHPLTMEKWAAVTGVSLDWLETGSAPTGPKPGGGIEDRSRRLAALASKKRPRHAGRFPTEPYVPAVA